MADNLDLWNKLGKTDPAHTKGFTRGGGFKGTAIKPIYTEQKMTETFGPCGVGWGINEPVYQVVNGSEGQVAVYCTTSIWINHGGKVSAPIYGVGGDLVVVKQKDFLRTDDEAFKKAFTDAVGNAMKHLGMSADVHMGLFDDSKYVQERRAEEQALEEVARDAGYRPAPPNPNGISKAKARPVDGEMRAEINACSTVEELETLWRSKAFKTEYDKHPADWQQSLVEYFKERKVDLTPKPIVKGYQEPNFDHLQTALGEGVPQ